MTDEWVTKDVHVHNGYYSATQNEIGSFVEMSYKWNHIVRCLLSGAFFT